MLYLLFVSPGLVQEPSCQMSSAATAEQWPIQAPSSQKEGFSSAGTQRSWSSPKPIWLVQPLFCSVRPQPGPELQHWKRRCVHLESSHLTPTRPPSLLLSPMHAATLTLPHELWPAIVIRPELRQHHLLLHWPGLQRLLVPHALAAVRHRWCAQSHHCALDGGLP